MSATLHVLLPGRRDFQPDAALQRWLARGDRLPDLADARRVILRELFQFDADALPVAALRHRAYAGGAMPGSWLCADPAYVRSEATGARLMGWPIDDLSTADAEALAEALRPLFAEVRAQLVVDTPTAWCVQLPGAISADGFTEPRAALGADLLDFLPEGTEGRAWRKLFSEVQVVLHAHSVNAVRQAAGKVPVNALWFWGAGSLPGAVTSGLRAVIATDLVLRGLARSAGIPCTEPAAAAGDPPDGAGDALLACTGHGGVAEAGTALAAAQRWLRSGRFDTALVVFASGERYRLRRAHGLRFWRRA